MKSSKSSIISSVFQFLVTACVIFIPGLSIASSADENATKGMELYRKQVFDQARQKFLEARAGKPNDPKISYNLGNRRYKQGKFDIALQDYSKSADQKSNSSVKQKSTYNMGNTLYRMDKLDESVAAY